MAHMEGIRRGVKANVEGSLAVVSPFPGFRFVGHLSNEATGHQFVIYFHTEVSFSIQLPSLQFLIVKYSIGFLLGFESQSFDIGSGPGCYLHLQSDPARCAVSAKRLLCRQFRMARPNPLPPAAPAGHPGFRP